MKHLRLYPHQIFDTTQLHKNIGAKSVSGGISTMASQGIIFVVGLSRTIVLARLLTPEDFGIIGMASVIIGFLDMFKNAGLSMATVQKKLITEGQISTLFWINLMISLALAVVVALSAPLLAAFYDRQELIPVTVALSSSFMLGGLTIQHAALLVKHMKFTTLALEKILVTIVGVVVAIVLALMGFRYWALVGSTIAIALANVALTYYFCPWTPGKFRRGTGVRDMLKFGGNVTGFNFVNYFSRNADNILIGKFIGAEALGLYAKAYQLFMLPLIQIRNPINNVALPVLSSLHNQPQSYLRYYQKLILTIAVISFPISLYLALEAEFIVLLVLGSQWVEAVPIFMILAISGVISPVVGTRGLVLLSMGYSRRYFYLGIMQALGNVTSFALGINYGIVGVAFAYVMGQYIMMIPLLQYTFHGTSVNLGIFFRAFLIPAINVSVATVIFLIPINEFVATTKFFYLIRFLVFFTVYCVLCLLNKSIRDIIKLIIREAMAKYYKLK